MSSFQGDSISSQCRFYFYLALLLCCHFCLFQLPEVSLSLVICSQSSKNENYFFYDDGDDDNDGGGDDGSDDDNYGDNDNGLEVHSPDWGSLKRKPVQQNSLHL